MVSDEKKSMDLDSSFEKLNRKPIVACSIEDHEFYYDVISNLFLFSGLGNCLFCNAFIQESVQLIKNSLMLYEEGFFDSAFYSLRQAVEIMNSMLMCSIDDSKYQNWKSKAWFPLDGKVKEALEQSCSNYSEIKNAIPEFFDQFDIILKQANKYIHKQGFDTFYSFIDIKGRYEKRKKARDDLYVSFLKYCIGMVLFLYIALDPLSLVATDEVVQHHIPFDYLTEPIPVSFFEEAFSTDYVERIKETLFYSSFKEFFLSKEELKPATYSLIHWQFYDLEHLSDIRSQLNLISPAEQRILTILEKGIKASRFYPEEYILGYFTSIASKAQYNGFSSNQFDEYLKEPFRSNITWRGVYISLFHMPNGYLIIEHNEPFSDDEVVTIEDCLK